MSPHLSEDGAPRLETMEASDKDGKPKVHEQYVAVEKYVPALLHACLTGTISTSSISGDY
jgi:hypothetical protein